MARWQLLGGAKRGRCCCFDGGVLHLFQGCEGLGVEERALQEIERAGVQRVEGGSKVAAVNCRDDVRSNGREGFDVVPVVDVAALLFQAVIGVERAESGLDEFGQGYEAELVGGLASVEEHAEVCGRELADLKRVFLFDVVGDEPVIFFAAEVVEVSPDVEGLLLEEAIVLCGEGAFFVGGRQS